MTYPWFNVCAPCLKAGILCTSERPACSHCREKGMSCKYPMQEYNISEGDVVKEIGEDEEDEWVEVELPATKAVRTAKK